MALQDIANGVQNGFHDVEEEQIAKEEHEAFANGQSETCQDLKTRFDEDVDDRRQESETSEEIKEVELFSLEYNIQTKKDKKPFELTSIIAVNGTDNIAVCDQSNSNIKIIDAKFHVKSNLEAVFQPWDITSIDSFLVASYPFVRMLQYLKVKPGGALYYWYPLHTGNEYYGLATLEDCVVATCRFDDSPNVPSIHFINKDGLITNIIHKCSKGRTIFVEPNYLDVNSKSRVIYVSDSGRRTVLSLTGSGDLLSEYTADGFAPLKISVNNVDGMVFVVDQSCDSILQLNEMLVPQKRIFGKYESIKRPLAAVYCKKTDRLFITVDKSAHIRVVEV